MHQHNRQTDGRRPDYYSNSALCTEVHRAININQLYCSRQLSLIYTNLPLALSHHINMHVFALKPYDLCIVRILGFLQLII